MYKRKRSVSRGRYLTASRKHARRVVGQRGEPYLRIPSRIPKTYAGGDVIIRKFRRFAEDVCIYSNGVGSVVALNTATGAQPAWITLSAVSADCAAAPNLYEFGIGISNQLTDIIESSEFITLFNEYQINKVEIKCWMDNAHTWGQGNSGIPNNIPSAYCVYDPNDKTVPATQAAVVARGDCSIQSFSQPFTVTYYPKVAAACYVSAVQSGYFAPASTKSQWIDVVSPSSQVEHYGYKMWLRNFVMSALTAQAGLVLRMQPIYYLSFRRTR